MITDYVHVQTRSGKLYEVAFDAASGEAIGVRVSLGALRWRSTWSLGRRLTLPARIAILMAKEKKHPGTGIP